MLLLKRHILLIVPLMLCMLAACRNDKDEPSVHENSMIAFGVKQQNGLGWSQLAVSRGTDKIEGVLPETIGVYGYNNIPGLSYSGAGEVFRNVEMFNKEGESLPDDLDLTPFADNNWPYYKPMPWIRSTAAQPANYKFYGYAPYVPPNQPIEPGGVYVTSIGASYDGYNGITLHNVPFFTDEDFLVGKELVYYQSVNVGSSEKNAVQMLNMKHLMARLRLCFQLGDYYSDLRVIHLHHIQIMKYSGNTYDFTVDFRNANPFGNPVENTSLSTNDKILTLDYELQDGDDPDLDHLELSKAYTSVFRPFSSLYVIPGAKFSSIHIKVIYDVYDVKGQLLRKDDTAENDIALPFGTGGTRTLEGGYYYDVNIRVVPSFLYVLSDNDPNYNEAITDGFLEIPK